MFPLGGTILLLVTMSRSLQVSWAQHATRVKGG